MTPSLQHRHPFYTARILGFSAFLAQNLEDLEELSQQSPSQVQQKDST
jgi:hypothetical protein